MSEYVPTIGLEIHAELKTRTKMFCSSKNDANEDRPNVNVCPVCMAHPGTLPVINREAVRYVLAVGAALGGKLADYTEFDRKNYFYPDLPKGYQLSQYEYPLVSGGELAGVVITRVHLEEDTASSMHDEATGMTTIDYNRAGVPLMELVTEPVITSAKQAGEFARELQLLLRYLGASEANMEKGEMRVEANISIAKKGERGTKVEIKNLNSFNTMERAVAYEIKRQSDVLERGEKVVQETRGWDENKQATFVQRSKEGSADYRYFPDPDLPSLRLSEVPEFSSKALERDLPELPWKRRARYIELGVKREDADVLIIESQLSNFFDQVTEKSVGISPQTVANYITNDLVKIIRDTEGLVTEQIAEVPISVASFGAILRMVDEKQISSRVAKDLLVECTKDPSADPERFVKEKGLARVGGTEDLSPIIDSILSQHSGVVDDYKKGKGNALEYLVGQGMKATRGAADPETLRQIIKARLS
jgi:aspartyl-tRNA(Asn)/glutamyl-tRNA(Gln) amidotransferase subunit B